MTVERSFFKTCLVAILDVVICFLLLLTASSSLAWDYVVGREQLCREVPVDAL